MSLNTQPLRNDRHTIMNHGVETALVFLLLIGFCARIWGIGITTTDDAIWALRIHQPDQHMVADFAIGQGRLWAWAGGAWVRYGLWYAGTRFADALLVGSFLLFFALFIRAVAVYWSAATAFATAGVFLAITVLHGDRTILTSYPGYFWMPASATIAAMLAARRYQRNGGLTALAACGLMTIVGLFTNEGGTLLTIVVVPAAILANHWQVPAASARRTQTVMAVFAALSLVFVAATLLYRWQHPSSYGGNNLAPFDLRRLLRTLLGFATGGTLFYDAIDPYRQTFPDTALDLNPGITYAPRQFLDAALTNAASLNAGGLVALLLLLVMGRRGARPALPLWSAATGCLCGLAIATLLVLPVAMTGQYQDWFFRYALHVYSHTLFATFGIALIVAILLNLTVGAAPRRLRSAAAAVIALGFGGLAMVSHQMNDTIMQAARPNAGRWRVVKDLLTIAHATGSEHDIIFVPRFKDEALSNFVKTPYWSDYVRARYGDPLRVTEQALSLHDIQDGAATADYHLTEDGRSFAVTVAHLSPSADPRPHADRITVLVEQTDPAMQNQILSFVDYRQGVRQIPLQALRLIGTRLWTLGGIDADPLSVRLGPLSFEQHLRLACGNEPGGKVLQFGAMGSGCDARAALRSGWSRTEQNGTWTDARTATLVLPTDGLPPGALTIAFDASGYAGMTPADQPQTVTVRVNGHDAASWVSRAGAAFQATPAVIAAADWSPGTPLTITFDIDPLYRPSPVGSAGDTRELGLYLRAVTLRPAA